MALAGSVFGEKDIAGIERYAAAIADTDLDAAAQSYYPAPPRRAMKVDDMRRIGIAEQMACGRFGVVQEDCCLGAFQLLEMRLTIVAGVEAVKFHGVLLGKSFQPRILVQNDAAKQSWNRFFVPTAEHDASACSRNRGSGR